MPVNQEESRSAFTDEATRTFKRIMANNQKNMFEDMNRANKGELFVLHHLSKNAAAVLPSELSAALRSSTARISALLGSLERKGQIERAIDKSNRRKVLVTITESGRARALRDTRERDENLARVFIELGEDDTAEFLRLSEQFFVLMQKYTAKEGVSSG